MITFKQFLFEALEGNPENQFKGRSYKVNDYSYRYSFPSSKGVGEVWIDQPKGSKTADVSFTIDGEHDTGRKSSPAETTSILNSVIDAVKHHAGKRNVDKISYISSPQKSRIFDRIITKLGKTPARRQHRPLMGPL